MALLQKTNWLQFDDVVDVCTLAVVSKKNRSFTFLRTVGIELGRSAVHSLR